MRILQGLGVCFRVCGGWEAVVFIGDTAKNKGEIQSLSARGLRTSLGPSAERLLRFARSAMATHAMKLHE